MQECTTKILSNELRPHLHANHLCTCKNNRFKQAHKSIHNQGLTWQWRIHNDRTVVAKFFYLCLQLLVFCNSFHHATASAWWDVDCHVGLADAFSLCCYADSLAVVTLADAKPCETTKAATKTISTVKPPNKGHFGDGPVVPCREVVLFSEVFF